MTLQTWSHRLQTASFSLTTISIGSAHRELANITHISSAMAIVSDNSTPNSDINMVFDPDNNIYDIGEGFEEGRGCSLLSSIYKPRSPSISSSECSEVSRSKNVNLVFSLFSFSFYFSFNLFFIFLFLEFWD